MLRIRYYGDSVLASVASPVDPSSETLPALAHELVQTMRAFRGVGLAAPQVGVSSRMFALGLKRTAWDGVVLINPKISRRSSDEVLGEEGCLSMPGVPVQVKRSSRITVRALRYQPGVDSAPAEVEFEASGFLARVIQHENDHLDGVTIVDRASAVQKMLAQKRWAASSLSRPRLLETSAA